MKIPKMRERRTVDQVGFRRAISYRIDKLSRHESKPDASGAAIVRYRRLDTKKRETVAVAVLRDDPSENEYYLGGRYFGLLLDRTTFIASGRIDAVRLDGTVMDLKTTSVRKP